MGLTILHTADWHLDSPFGSFPEELRKQLHREQLRIPEMAAALCQREHCDLVLLAGDIFDGAPGAESVAALKRFAENCRVPVLVSPGNHDYWGADAVWSRERWPENLYIFWGAPECVVLKELDCRIYGAGYQSMDCRGLLEGFRAEGNEKYQIGLFHGDPLNVGSPCCPITTGQVRGSNLDYLALGHIHRSGSFRIGKTLCAWPGCPMGRGWGETGERGMFLVKLDDRAELTWIPTGTAQFHDLEVRSDGDWTMALESVLPAAESPDLFRVTLRGEQKPELRELNKQFSYLRWLELRDETHAPRDLWELSDQDSLIGTYFRLLREEQERGNPAAELAGEISRRLLEDREVELP